MTHVNPFLQQQGFRGFEDDGAPGSATAIATENTNWTQDVDQNFRIRLELEERDGGTENNVQLRLQYNLNTTGWNDITTSSSVVQAVPSPHYTDEDADNVDRLTTSSQTFSNGVLDENGLAGQNNQIDFAGSEVIEIEYCLQIVGADVSDTDTIQLRIVRDGGTLDAWQTDPTLTVNKVSGTDFVRSITDTVGIADTVTTSRNLVISLADSVGITDVISTARDLIVSLADSIDITDVLSIPGSGGNVVVAVTRVAADTNGGTQQITTPDLNGETPKAALFIMGDGTTDGTVAPNETISVGAATSSTDRWCSWGFAENGVSTSNTLAGTFDDRIIRNYDGTIQAQADFSQFVTDGVEISWSTTPSTDFLLTVVLFAGDDLQAHAGHITVQNIDQATNDVTAPGFEPDILIGATSTRSSINSPTGTMLNTLGVAHNDRASTVTQYCVTVGRGNNQSPARMVSTIRDDAYAADIHVGTASLETRFTLEDFDANGFTIREHGTDQAIPITWLALRLEGGTSSWVGDIVTPTSTGQQSNTEPGFKPQFVLSLSNLMETYGAEHNNGVESGGAGVSVFDENDSFSTTTHMEQGADPTNTGSISDDLALKQLQDDELDSIDASFTSFDTNGFTLNYTNVLGTSKLFPSLAIESAADISEILVSIADSIGVTDAISTSRDLAILLTDPIGVADVLTTSINKIVSLVESVGITDVLTTSRNLIIGLADSVGITDTISTALGKVVSLADSVGITDVISTIVGAGGSGFIAVQTFEEPGPINSTTIDFTNITLDSSTEKIVCVIETALYDVATDPSISSVTWDQGGNNESLTHVPNSEGSLLFQTDRYLKSDIWVLDNPSLVSNATLRVTLSDSPSSGAMIIGIYEFDSAADSGTSGDVGIDTGTGSSDPSISLTTRDSDSMALMGGVHQVADANPFTIGGILSTKDNDSDAGGSWPILLAHGNGTGGVDTASYTQSVQRRFAASAYEVLISVSGAADVIVALADTVGITDTISTSRNIAITLVDSVDVSDILTTAVNKVITLVEAINITDALTTTLGKVVTLSDTVGITDTLVTARDVIVSLSDPVGIVDTLTTEVQQLIEVVIQDTVGIADTLTTARDLVLSISNSIGITDVITNSRDIVVLLTEGIDVTDVISTSVGRIVSISDNIGITDALQTARNIVVALSDPVVVVDTIFTEVQQLIEVLIQDTVDVADVVTTARELVISLSDTIGITDVINTARDVVVTLVETVDILDTLQTGRNIVVSISDTIGITDVIDTVISAGEIFVSIADNVSVTDTVSTVSDYARTINESVGITDTIDTIGNFITSISDTVTISDTLTTARDVIISITDSVGITDAISTAKLVIASIADSVSIADTISISRALVRNITDSLDVTDTIGFVQTLIRQISDAVGITDTLTSTGTYFRSIADSINITDTITTNVGNLISVLIEETVDVTDTIGGIAEVLVVKFNEIRGVVRITPIIESVNRITPSIEDVVRITREIRERLRL